MKGRWMLVGALIGAALVLTLGWASARPATGWPGPSTTAGRGWTWEDMEAMHESPGMRQMHAQMPADVQAQCDAMHERMEEVAGGAGQPGGGMMPGSGMMPGGMMQ